MSKVTKYTYRHYPRHGRESIWLEFSNGTVASNVAAIYSDYPLLTRDFEILERMFQRWVTSDWFADNAILPISESIDCIFDTYIPVKRMSAYEQSHECQSSDVHQKELHQRKFMLHLCAAFAVLDAVAIAKAYVWYESSGSNFFSTPGFCFFLSSYLMLSIGRLVFKIYAGRLDD